MTWDTEVWWRVYVCPWQIETWWMSRVQNETQHPIEHRKGIRKEKLVVARSAFENQQDIQCELYPQVDQLYQ
jgi:hypothetical protein